MTFAPQSLYALGSDPFPICGLTVLEDQHLAGLIMWIPMDAIFIAVAAWLFVAWFRDAERTMVRHETQRLADRPGPRLIANIALLGGLGSGLAGCNEAAFPEAVNLDGNSRNGAMLIAQFGCGKCHVIPGISGADGVVGPPLTAVGRRIFIAGLLNNSPDNMMAWLQDPQAIVPGNAMPQMDISVQQARDI